MERFKVVPAKMIDGTDVFAISLIRDLGVRFTYAYRTELAATIVMLRLELNIDSGKISEVNSTGINFNRLNPVSIVSEEIEAKIIEASEGTES